MSLPAAVRRDLERRFGPVRGAEPVGGGCIHTAVRVELEDGSALFVKHNERAPERMFATEARGLRALAAGDGGLRVPGVLAVCDAADATPGEPAWIALEWLEPGERASDFGAKLGRGLAEIHRRRVEGWGWSEDNFIGSLPQENAVAHSWADFWRLRRLEPQLKRARRLGRLPGTEREWDRLYGRLPELLAVGEEEGPSLLHGDLWNGNVLSAGGEPALVDPAVYRGHREVDLAMSELFGGFGEDFYAAYGELWPLRPGYREWRRPVYQLFYLLVHVNLFGGDYVHRTADTLHLLVR